MCGIISALSFDDGVSESLLSALERLEYRGYDSAGIAYIDGNSRLHRIRTVGRIKTLREAVERQSVKANVGIGHTRWATHGKVTELNAHPHSADGVAIVHNGIIENYQELRKRLVAAGYSFESETDSEVIAKLIAFNMKSGASFEAAFKQAISKFVGTFAIAAIYEAEPDVLIGAKRGSPMAVGLSKDGRSCFIASDAVALSSLADEIAYLEEGDIVVARKGDTLRYEICNASGETVVREVVPNRVSLDDVTKNGYETFMLKEIFEEPRVARNTYDKFDYYVDLSKFPGVSIIACGTSYYAGLLAKYWLEDIAGIHVDVEIASEFRYRNPVLFKNSLYVFISQSGETIDTLCAMRLVKAAGIKTLALVNVDASSIAREADYVIKTVAGVEVGVASTKAFVAQTLSMLLLAKRKADFDIDVVESAMNSVLNKSHEFAKTAEKLKSGRSLFYVGRGTSYPISLEGALKIKELSYVSAEGYPSGEIKHGPIAIVDDCVHTVAIAPFDKHFEKTVSNTQEILARNGKVILLTTDAARGSLHGLDANENVDCIFLPDCDALYQPFPLTTAIHLLAYHTAKAKGYDVDKPRNLAKSVTVE